jgi:hypothetical protein
MIALNTVEAEAIATQVVGELVKNKRPEDVINMTVDEALSKVIPFTEMIEDKVVSKFMSVLEESVNAVKKKGGLVQTTIWEIPTLNTILDRE